MTSCLRHAKIAVVVLLQPFVVKAPKPLTYTVVSDVSVFCNVVIFVYLYVCLRVSFLLSSVVLCSPPHFSVRIIALTRLYNAYVSPMFGSESNIMSNSDFDYVTLLLFFYYIDSRTRSVGSRETAVCVVLFNANRSPLNILVRL